MIALEHDGPLRGFLTLHPTGRRSLEFEVLVQDGAVEFHFEEFEVRCLVARGIKLWGLVFKDILLPFAGLFAGVDGGWRGSVDGTHVAVAEFFLPIAVQDLHFVLAHEVNAGVGALGHHEFQFHTAAAKLGVGINIEALAMTTHQIDHGALAGRCRERILIFRQGRRAHDPLGLDRLALFGLLFLE